MKKIILLLIVLILTVVGFLRGAHDSTCTALRAESDSD